MKKIIASIVSFAPALALAQTAPITDVNSLSTKLINLGNLFTYLLMAAAVIFIIWNIVKYLIAGGEEDRSAALKNFIWGIVGLFLIISIWGIVNILLNTFRTTPPPTTIPQVQNINNGRIPFVQ